MARDMAVAMVEREKGIRGMREERKGFELEVLRALNSR
jgi:hypothetical protein